MSDVTKDTVLDDIVAGFERLQKSGVRHASITFDVFNAAVKEVPDTVIRAYHVAAFADQSTRYPEEDIDVLWGYYVSALACMCVDKQSEVGTERLKGLPRSVGAYLKGASLTVIGNVGNSFGHSMRSGRLILAGNAHWGVGYGMKGGELIVQGDCGQGVGDAMDGTGIIRIQGKYERLGRPIKGEIYQGSQKVWPIEYKQKWR